LLFFRRQVVFRILVRDFDETAARHKLFVV
jgi:hypothetical protein